MKSAGISPMVLEDLDDIEEIEGLSFTIPWTRQAFVRELCENPIARYFTVRDKGRAVAYGGMWIIVDEAHITNLAVHPEYRGKGIGRMLLKGMIDYGIENGIESFTLEVRESNLIAINLYSQLGFKKAGIRKCYYSDTNENALVMWLRLKNNSSWTSG
jgi:ribosomal-protein-alanine N-acetyltransferase